MSLFKARDWWSVVSGFEEFHASRLLITTSLDPNLLQYDECILVGSFAGILRAYRPKSGGYSPDHLLLEKQLDGPIIQLAVEHVVDDGVVTICLIVLHPREVVIYSLSVDEDNLILSPKYRHKLTHITYNMVTGPLGRTAGHDLICIQAVDGVLTVIDHSEILFTCTMANFFLPGPMVYNPRTDTIVTVGSTRQLEVYRYQSLLTSGGHKAKSVNSEWSIELGEEAVDVKVAVHEDGPSLILVLGERNVYCFKDNSQLVFCKKLEHSFSSIHPYRTEYTPSTTGGTSESIVYYLLAGHTQQLQVMKNEKMVWAAQLPHVPIAMTTANFSELQGVIVTLDEIGHVQCSYLGTDPTAHVRGGTYGMGGVSSNHSLREMDEELKELSSKIVEHEESNKDANNDQKLTIEVLGFSKPRPVEGSEEVVEDSETSGEEAIKRQCVECRIRVSNPSPMTSLHNIQLDIDVTPPITVHPSTISYPSIIKGESEEFTLTAVCSGDIPAATLDLTMTVSYVNEDKFVLNLDHTFFLPLELICNPCVPEDGQFKVTLDSSLPCVGLAELYPNNEEGKSANAQAYKLLSGPTVTFITSKTSDRYRVQSNEFACLGLFVDDLVRRLGQYHSNKNQLIKLKASSQMPLTDYFELIDEHYKVRVGLEQCKELLSRHSHQFRAIQKRLLSRFKDKTPVGLSHLDTLLDGTYMQLMMLADKHDDMYQQEQALIRKLSSASLLIITFLKLNMSLNDEEVCILQSTLAPNVVFNSEQGWEEVIDMGVTQLLRSCLAKSTKDQSTSLPELKIPSDCLKVKRHLALLCDRILKGGKLSTATRSLMMTTPTTLGQLPAVTEEATEQ